MVTRILIKDAVVFDKVVLEPDYGLNIFSGPSGAGKSVLVSAMLSIFGFNDLNGALCEANIKDVLSDNELVEEENIVRCVKKDKSRYFLNDSQISKKLLQEILLKSVRFLNHKDRSDLSKEALLELVDLNVKKGDFLTKKQNFKEKFREYEILKDEIKKEKERREDLEEKKEFIAYEIEKINAIKPKPKEYEELLETKKRLSKKEKIEESIIRAKEIFEYENFVIEALNLSGEDSDFFTDTMGELSQRLENSLEKIEELDEIKADELLDRIEKLSYLVKRYGGEEQALEYLEEKTKELLYYEDFDNSLKEKTQKVELLEKELSKEAEEISKLRQKEKSILEEKINHYLKKLKLSSLSFEFLKTKLTIHGVDEISVTLKNVDLKKISSGEFNRLRLSILAAKIDLDKNQKGVLFLDEIDANVSGEESEAIGEIVKELSLKYQIFAISHQPQLSSKANRHFLVEKDGNKSKVRLLDLEDRQKEIGRMISGKEITKEALSHAKRLLDERSH